MCTYISINILLETLKIVGMGILPHLAPACEFTPEVGFACRWHWWIPIPGPASYRNKNIQQ